MSIFVLYCQYPIWTDLYFCYMQYDPHPSLAELKPFTVIQSRLCSRSVLHKFSFCSFVLTLTPLCFCLYNVILFFSSYFFSPMSLLLSSIVERRRRFNINDRIKELGTMIPKTNDL